MWEPPLGKANNVDEEMSMWLTFKSMKDYKGFSGLIK